jgi:AcrR family transcriptional regulator
MEAIQRTRVLEAMAEEMAAGGGGAGGATVALTRVIARAGVSGGAFHEAFPDREACLLAAFELGVERAGRTVLAAYEAESRWLDSIKSALVASLAFVEDEPALARLLLVYSLGGDESLLRRRVEVLRALAAAVDRGRLEMPAASQQPPPVIAEGVVGAVLAVLHNRLLAGESAGVMDLFGSLVSIVVLPYLGAGVARRELRRPPPRLRASAGWSGHGARAIVDPDGAVRLTYRTVRVLQAIADYPGASNREVADRAGIVDQGQTSRLLGRLRARGLIGKLGDGSARGAPNSWRLTERGERALGDTSASS